MNRKTLLTIAVIAMSGLGLSQAFADDATTTVSTDTQSYTATNANTAMGQQRMGGMRRGQGQRGGDLRQYINACHDASSASDTACQTLITKVREMDIPSAPPKQQDTQGGIGQQNDGMSPLNQMSSDASTDTASNSGQSRMERMQAMRAQMMSNSSDSA